MDIRPDSLNIISLCTGGGGLDRAVELAIPSARPIACVEREAFAVANLVSQMQRGVMAPAPIHGDVRTFPGRRFRGGVDGVIGGIPCQPYSFAGKRLGRNDERDLWGAARRIFVQSGAWFILIENVGGMLSEGGAERVRGDLLRLGCKVAGGLFRASEVGHPHERERLFILGVADRDGVDGYRRGVFGAGWRGQPSDGRSGMAPAELGGCEGRDPAGSGADTALPSDSSVGDAAVIGREGSRSSRSPADLRRRPADPGYALADPNLAVLRGQPSAGQQPLIQSHDGVGGTASAELDDAPRHDGRLHEGRRLQGIGAPDAGGASQMADTLGGGRDGWPCEPEWSEEERAAVEWASHGPLSAPGPGDVGAWRWIMERVPERLPAVSRRDLFFHAIRKARAAADRDPAARGDLDPQGPFGLRAPVVQALAESHLRRGSHGVAPRIDQLRMLGNGVDDLEGAYAVRSVATDLSPRSAGAARLVRLMALDPISERTAA